MDRVHLLKADLSTLDAFVDVVVVVVADDVP